MLRRFNNYASHCALVFCFMLNAVLIKFSFAYKSWLLLFINLGLIFILCVKLTSTKRVIDYFIYLDNDKVYKKISGLITLISWVLVYCSLLMINLQIMSVGRWLLLGFCGLVMISAVTVFYDIARSHNRLISRLQWLFGVLISLLYFVTSALAASYFKELSNVNLSDTPWVELWFKITLFCLYFFLLLQPLSYAVFLYLADKVKGGKLATLFGLLLVTALLFAAVPRWANNFIVLVFNETINGEWREFALCGKKKIAVKNEKYFGFNEERYTVYFSNRDNQWGFESLICSKDAQGNDSENRVTISHSPMPTWFKP